MSKKFCMNFKFIDGAYFFVAGDEYSQGLCVAHTDLAIACQGAIEALQHLLSDNYGINIKLTPEAPITAILEWLDESSNCLEAGDEDFTRAIDLREFHPYQRAA